MKKFLAIFMICLPLAMSAQTDSKAKAFFDKTIAVLQNTPIQTDFSVVYENAVTDEHETKQGKLLLKGNKFYFALENMELFFDGKTQWMYMQDVDEVSVSEPTGKELSEINPILMVKEFRKTHMVQFDADDAATSPNRLLNLYPLDKSVDHFKVALVVKENTKQIVSIKISFKNGTSTLFSTKNYQMLKTLADSAFTFDKSKYPNVMINDLR
ncbi:MAG: outer membrane lipoprotein carrier protein LolA [Paludibacteraceae bacterium]